MICEFQNENYVRAIGEFRGYNLTSNGSPKRERLKKYRLRSQEISPKLLRRMQSSAAYRVNVCMVIYPPGSQNLHPAWPTYRELWLQCHTTAPSLREAYKEIGALSSPSITVNARLLHYAGETSIVFAERKYSMTAVTFDFR